MTSAELTQHGAGRGGPSKDYCPHKEKKRESSAVGSPVAVASPGETCCASFLMGTWLFSLAEELGTLLLQRVAVVHFWGALVFILSTTSRLQPTDIDPLSC